MDDFQAINGNHTDIDRTSSGGKVREGNETDQPDEPTVENWCDTEAESRVDVGVLVAHPPGGDVEPLRSIAERMARDGIDELATATDAAWRVHCTEPDPRSPIVLPDDRPSSV